MIREIDAAEITREIRRLCIEANRELPADMEQCIRCAAERDIISSKLPPSIRRLCHS